MDSTIKSQKKNHTFQVVLSKLPIGDVATQYFADRGMFCAGRVPEEDLKRTMKACGGSIVVSAKKLQLLFSN